MRFPNKEQIEMLRKEYPAGTKVELLAMDDKQAPPVGTIGEVIALIFKVPASVHRNMLSTICMDFHHSSCPVRMNFTYCALWSSMYRTRSK